MNETVISWTVANWITVLLMVFLGSAAIGLTAKLIQNARNAAE